MEEDIRALAEPVEAVLAQRNLCVIGNEETITRQQALFLNTEQLF